MNIKYKVYYLSANGIKRMLSQHSTCIFVDFKQKLSDPRYPLHDELTLTAWCWLVILLINHEYCPCKACSRYVSLDKTRSPDNVYSLYSCVLWPWLSIRHITVMDALKGKSISKLYCNALNINEMMSHSKNPA